ncbi:MAG: hypothetical protein CBC13_02085 [Planctomycetia bacterium TMED53]|nr:MAG: hypothetical protein CBC13_02085 [Planctomycetia bacterium TMED53]
MSVDSDDQILAQEGCGSRRDSRFRALSEECAYEGHRYSMFSLKEELPDGKTASRDVIRHPGAAVILPLVNSETVCLIEQHRSVFGHNLLEIPAGLMEEGESALECARRELREETGFEAGSIEPIMVIYPAAGFCDEKMFLFLATDLTAVGQDTDDDEWVKVLSCSKSRAQELLARGEIRDAKTIIALQYWLGRTP